MSLDHTKRIVADAAEQYILLTGPDDTEGIADGLFESNWAAIHVKADGERMRSRVPLGVVRKALQHDRRFSKDDSGRFHLKTEQD